MAGLLDQLKEFIVASVGSWGYLAVFLLMTLESACIPIPSEVTMPVAGLLASQGKLSFFWVGLMGAGANVAGSWIAYLAGAAGGRPLLEKYGRYVLIKEHDLDRADAWFERHGDAAVFISRLLPVIRTFISLPAGIARMPFLRFTILTFLGSLPWSFALTWAGYLLGANWDRILPYTEPVTYTLAGGLLTLMVVWLVRRARRAEAG